MCLAVPAEVLELKDNDMALAEIGGIRREVCLMLVDGVREGDYVLVHAGFAIERIDEEEARRTLELFEEITRLDEVY
ncbi:MAG: HypC/HybG/HupF family hydrogenase formation chaperone [Actinomycetota bacterium]|nr:HypC/HybG/HupF family hydrogenase formation chaperone [Actinomycetota bacterium]